MSRLPFDPEKMIGPKAAPRDSGPLSVSQLAAMIDSSLRNGLPTRIAVIGEVSGFRERTHWYFDVKDADAVLGCVVFASAARKAGCTPENGRQVIVTGRVEFWARGGKTSFIVEKIEPAGIGALEQEFRRLCEELRQLGWFAPERKRPLPSFARRIAVVTSRSGAAYQDVLDTMRRRCPAVGVVLVDVRVQGDGAAQEIERAIDALSRSGGRLEIDAIILTRGGGSMEDLWAFNERRVARAILECSLPVAAAIGHETDTTIAELVADERCATPTQAAMRLTPDRSALEDQVRSLTRRLQACTRQRLNQEANRVRSAVRSRVFSDPRTTARSARIRLEGAARQLRSGVVGRAGGAGRRLEHVARRLETHRPAALHAARSTRLEKAVQGLNAAVRHRLAGTVVEASARELARAASRSMEDRARRLDAAARQLGAVGPMSVLRRGFSYTVRDDGSLVRSPGDVRRGDLIQTRLADGSIRSRVENGPGRGGEVGGSRRAPAKRGRVDGGGPQMDLFTPTE